MISRRLARFSTHGIPLRRRSRTSPRTTCSALFLVMLNRSIYSTSSTTSPICTPMVLISLYNYQGLRRQLDITLSNGDFLYKKASELKVVKSNVLRHDRSSHWCQLDRSVILTWFNSHYRFSQHFFQKEPMECKVWYNNVTERIQFKAYTESREYCLAITLRTWGPIRRF